MCFEDSGGFQTCSIFISFMNYCPVFITRRPVHTLRHTLHYKDIDNWSASTTDSYSYCIYHSVIGLGSQVTPFEQSPCARQHNPNAPTCKDGKIVQYIPCLPVNIHIIQQHQQSLERKQHVAQTVPSPHLGVHRQTRFSLISYLLRIHVRQ